MNKVLADIIKRAEKWPKERQEELVSFFSEIEAELKDGVYHATPQELKAIDEADKSGIASEKKVKAAFRAFRRA